MSTQPLLQTAPGKRIALPTRIEPKVYFANERTFLSWLNFTALLGGLAIGLLNFGDRVGQISAALFTAVAMATMLYALYTFHWRARSIRLRGQSGFDDRFGPSVLAVALLGAVVVNFALRVREGRGLSGGVDHGGGVEGGGSNSGSEGGGGAMVQGFDSREGLGMGVSMAGELR